MLIDTDSNTLHCQAKEALHFGINHSTETLAKPGPLQYSTNLLSLTHN